MGRRRVNTAPRSPSHHIIEQDSDGSSLTRSPGPLSWLHYVPDPDPGTHSQGRARGHDLPMSSPRPVETRVCICRGVWLCLRRCVVTLWTCSWKHLLGEEGVPAACGPQAGAFVSSHGKQPGEPSFPADLPSDRYSAPWAGQTAPSLSLGLPWWHLDSRENVTS